MSRFIQVPENSLRGLFRVGAQGIVALLLSWGPAQVVFGWFGWDDPHEGLLLTIVLTVYWQVGNWAQNQSWSDRPVIRWIVDGLMGGGVPPKYTPVEGE